MSNSSKAEPRFLIHLNGTRLAVEKEADILQILIYDKLGAPSLFCIKVSDKNFYWIDSEDFFVGAEVTISLGYDEELEVLMEGEITGIEAHFKQKFGKIVTIKGKNLLHRLDRAITTAAFTEMTDSEIVENLASQASLSSDVLNAGTKSHLQLQHKRTGLEYIMEFARNNDCFVRMEGKKKLICKPIPATTGETLVLEKNKTLLTFNGWLDSTQMISEMTVYGWDKGKIEKFDGSSAASDVNSSGGEAVEQKFGGAKETFFDYKVSDITSAEKRAKNMLAHNGRKYIQAAGSCKGDNRIRAGSILRLEGMSKEFAGKYLVVSAIHSITPDKGYKTDFNLEKFVSASSGSEQSQPQDEQKQDQKKEENNDNSQTNKSPAIKNLKWMFEDAEVSKVHVDDKIVLAADTTDIDDGISCSFFMYEKDYDDDAKYLVKGAASVSKNKVSLDYLVNLDEDRIRELLADSKDGVLPEFVFVIECGRHAIRTGNSPVLEIYSWINSQLRNENTSEILADTEYTLHFPDGSTEDGTTDDKGYVVKKDLKYADFYISLKEDDDE